MANPPASLPPPQARARALNQRFDAAAALYQGGRVADAERLYAAILDADPRHFGALHNLGYIRLKQARRPEAADLLRRAIKARPKSPAAHNTLGLVLHTEGRFKEAAASFEKALALDPADPEPHNNLGAALHLLGRYERAIAFYRKALSLRPNYADAQNNLGNALQVLGRLDEARAAFEAAVGIDPRRASFQLGLAGSKRFTRDDPHLARMEELAGKLASMPDADRMHLHFALGKALADAGEHDRSFTHLLAGNSIKRRQIAYDEAATLRRFESIRDAFNAPMRGDEAGAASARPIFVIGMPRSGTTLIEQILASHPDVFGAGERADFRHAVEAVLGDGHPEAAPGAPASRLRAIGNRYLDGVGALAPSRARRIVDKMPTNFLFAGMIAMALPNARIIHASRDPADTCVSCFATLFRGELPFTYELGELGRYYRAYEALMAHWREVLPPGMMLDMRYEDLIDDLPPAAQRLIAHCGLEWDPACLDFHRTERPVLTASAGQVRRPLYRTSVGRWRAYGDRLRPLLDALGTDGSDGHASQ